MSQTLRDVNGTERLPPFSYQQLRELTVPDLPLSRDGRKPFPVTDPGFDAPWGAVLYLEPQDGYPGSGWYQRGEREWYPVVVPDELQEAPTPDSG